MKTTLKLPSVLATITLAAAFALTGCGGGDDSSSDLADNPVGTKGDSINRNELAALKCGMNKEQVLAIVGDTPIADETYGELGFMRWSAPAGYSYSTNFRNGALYEVWAGKGGNTPPDLVC